MENIKYINDYLTNSIEVKNKLLLCKDTISSIALVSEKIIECYKADKKVMLAGNGGSAADSQHIAAEFVSRFFFDRPGLSAIALTTDTSMLTAIGNDYGFKNIFSRQVQAQGSPGDIFIGISTSGNSENIIEAVEMAKNNKIISVVFCGSGGILASKADISIQVPSDSTPFIQECHICIAHIICAIVEKTLFKPPKK